MADVAEALAVVPPVTEVKTVETTREELQEILKKKYADYEFLGDYGVRKITLRRWPWKDSISLYPQSVEIIASILSNIVMDDAKNTGIDFLFNSLANVNAKLLEKNLEGINKIIQRSIVMVVDNKLDSRQAEAFVSDFEVVDIIGICRLLYELNVEHVLKNGFGGLLKKEVVKQ